MESKRLTNEEDKQLIRLIKKEIFDKTIPIIETIKNTLK
jgi:hypothetical protein